MKTIVVQKAILKNADGDVLMLRRSKTDVRRPMQWDFPGGMLDEGESLEDCVMREIKEEAGLVAKELRPVFSKTEVRKWKDHDGEHTNNVVFIFYSVEVLEDEPKLSYEHDKFQWSSPAEALKQIKYPLHKELLTHLIKNQLI